MPRKIAALAAVAGVTVAGCASSTTAHPTSTTANRTTTAAATTPPPTVPPPGSDFVRTIDNPWFPLRPGTVLTYEGEDEGTPARDVLRVTARTKKILGIRATVIDDRVIEHGHAVERTNDYYAQDKQGNVWYLGEDTATLKPNGQVKSRAGTFRAGRDGARGGIFMPANPKRGDRGWQEYYVGHAQDRFKVLNLRTKVRTGAVTSRQAMLVQETTPLERGVVDHKIYVRGIGTVRERTVRGGNETYDLVSIQRPHAPR